MRILRYIYDGVIQRPCGTWVKHEKQDPVLRIRNQLPRFFQVGLAGNGREPTNPE